MNTMSSYTSNTQPSLLDKKPSRERIWPITDYGATEHISAPTASFMTTSFAASNLLPYTHVASNSTSPVNNASTPADSLSAFSEQYPSSDFSDSFDPLFRVDYDVEGTPSFLEDAATSLEDSSDNSEPYPQTLSFAPAQNVCEPRIGPISPGSAPYVHTTSPLAEQASLAFLGNDSLDSVSHAPPHPPKLVPSDFTPSRLTPQSRTGTNTTSSSEECPTSTTAPMPSPSPRVTVSMWGRDQVHDEVSFPEGDETIVRAGGVSANGMLASASYHGTSPNRDGQGSWAASSTAGPSGWSPETRTTIEGASVNELNVQRKVAERNEVVDKWRSTYETGGSHEDPAAPLDALAVEDVDGIHEREIPLGNRTENKPLPGQTYYTERGGSITEDDLKLMRQPHVWMDGPKVYRINGSERTQPETAAAAIQQFEQMNQETGSMLSRSATWGTRRLSLPSIADIEGVTNGSFLKKLSISRDRKPSITLESLRGLQNRFLHRKPSANQLLKRHRSVPEDEDVEGNDPPTQGRRESRDTLAPPNRTTSWAKKPTRPPLNTAGALVSISTGAATIGTMHARTSSISNVPSPKSPLFKNLRRARSRSELPPTAFNEDSHSNLASIWKQSGGPPVAQLARGRTVPDLDDEEDDDDDSYDECGTGTGVSNIFDGITPNFAGFKQQILKMNPTLAQQNTYLVDRIAHQQVVRYKDLLNKRIKHMQQTNAGKCPSGHMCINSGGSAITFGVKDESRGVDPLATNYEADSDGDGMPVEGAINAESFPRDIPMPPATSLPAEFECQLCYTTKKFTKPSDWTKHVHEDVQPFTCTWDRCREPKIFKRKADWVRHENEGHRHLEWWKCDVEDCRHICHRRDNFLQHLVREHKFPEPKVKTKAAVKREGGKDITWAKVEKCHSDTFSKPQDEPCRFCGKTLPTWKKLTVHLAKHMENMSLPILRLVAAKDLDADTIISPVQDPPPRSFPPVKSEPQSFSVSPSLGHSPAVPIHQQSGLAYPVSAHPSYPHFQPTAFPDFYDSTLPGLQQPNALNMGLHHQPDVSTSFPGGAQTGYQNLPVSTGAYMGNGGFNTLAQQLEPFPAYTNPLGLQDALYDTAALNTPGFGGGEQQQQHYSQQGSASPYARSPHQGQGGGFYPQ